jgi:hypothetical protein
MKKPGAVSARAICTIVQSAVLLPESRFKRKGIFFAIFDQPAGANDYAGTGCSNQRIKVRPARLVSFRSTVGEPCLEAADECPDPAPEGFQRSEHA